MESYKFKYLPQEEFERILFKVQQARQDEVDEWRWQMHLAEINKVPDEKCQDSSTSSTVSDDTRTSSDELHRKVDGQKQNYLIAQQHVKTCEAIKRMQSSIIGVLADISSQFIELKTKEVEEPTSPRAAKHRIIRVSEFNARFRRNHLYHLQVEIEKASRVPSSQMSSMNCGPRHTTRQLALRSLERVYVLVLQALQVFQRQSRVLTELLSTHHLMRDLLLQLARLSEISAAFELPNQDLDSQRHKLDTQFVTNVLEEDMAQLGLTAPTKKLTKKKPLLSAAQARSKRAHQSKNTDKSQKSRKPLVCKPQIGQRALEHDRGELSQPQDVSQSTECILDTKTSSSQEKQQQEQPPVNVRVYVMQHDAVAPPCANLTEVHDAGTQTLRVQSRAVGTDIPSVTGDSTTEEEQLDQLSLHRPSNDSFTLRLQRAVLEELRGDTNIHLDPLIEQLLREEFL